MKQTKGNIEAIYGLTPMQAGILFHTLHAPTSTLYFEQYACTLEGDLELQSWEEAWQQVVVRHAILRTLFTWEKRDEPLQIVRQKVQIPWYREDLRSESDPSARIADYLVADRERGFELEQAPLIRLALFRTGESSHRFVWSFHHLILDGWSMRQVLNEAFHCYESRQLHKDPHLAAARSYRAYVAWLHEQSLDEAEEFWREHLRGFESPTPLPIESPGPHPRWAERHMTCSHRVSGQGTAQLEKFAREHRVTLNTVVRAAWSMVLAHYSREFDVIFGATVSGRPHSLTGAAETVGLFINTLPVRVNLAGNAPVHSWLQTLQREQLEASAFEFAPLVKIQKWSEVSGSLFQTLLVFENLTENGSGAESREPSLRVSDPLYVEQSNYPLAILVVPGTELEFLFVYDADRYAPAAIERLATHLETGLQSILNHPDARPRDLEILPASEREQLLNVHSRGRPTSKAESASGPGMRVQERIASYAESTPDVIAITTGLSHCTYGTLGEQTESAAVLLRTLGAGPGKLVAIALDRSLEMIVGILAILRSGAAYVPLDPHQPDERIRFILEDTGALALVTTSELIDTLAPRNIPVLSIAPDLTSTLPSPLPGTAAGQSTADTPESSPVPAAGPDLAYILYTSGSTGRPKGVQITHDNLDHSTEARVQYYGEAPPRYLLVSPFVFDSSVAGIFWTLSQGGTLVLPAPGMERDVHALAGLIEAEQVTHVLALPTLYGLLLELADPAQLATLAVVILAGEAAAPTVAQAHFSRLPTAALFNEYGPTEATVWSTVHRIEPADVQNRVPIGRAIARTRTFILDQSLRPVPFGVPGELCLAGAGLARGYLNDDTLTAERFVLFDPGDGKPFRIYRTGDLARYLPDGNLEFLGRLDDQVKIHGHRIELGEIEAVLKDLPDVRDAVALVLRNESRGEVSSDVDTLCMRMETADPAAAADLLETIEAMGSDEVETLLSQNLGPTGPLSQESL